MEEPPHHKSYSLGNEIKGDQSILHQLKGILDITSYNYVEGTNLCMFLVTPLATSFHF